MNIMKLLNNNNGNNNNENRGEKFFEVKLSGDFILHKKLYNSEVLLLVYIIMYLAMKRVTPPWDIPYGIIQ